MKQTAVEWLVDELQIFATKEEMDIIEQAKEMEKEQLRNSYKQGFKYRDTWNWELETDWEIHSNKENEQSFEQYYNETFNNK